MTTTEPALTGREIALLRAVAAGRGEIVCGCVPDLLIDGCWCGDQHTAHRLAARGLIRPDMPASAHTRVPAILTESGRACIATPLAA
ncbi:hypothetical protein EV191_101421 [Tamaricihabitans halophyticus]|uniref:Uncharacterized protein n=1 Tax=Tamaricihabitans halophyticus TaxID=1262583 RepID=A0A4R2R475_9PSEU|nr:hypothetical protein [Tamaricihabitans halophyticus]TCP56478.1 hypothetical protein EV191_101421 [Tamaricihabitans halophyticus]